MKYIISEKEKKMQRNLLFQLWRLIVLSIRFTKLTRTGCELPPAVRERQTTKEPGTKKAA